MRVLVSVLYLYLISIKGEVREAVNTGRILILFIQETRANIGGTVLIQLS